MIFQFHGLVFIRNYTKIIARKFRFYLALHRIYEIKINDIGIIIIVNTSNKALFPFAFVGVKSYGSSHK